MLTEKKELHDKHEGTLKPTPMEQIQAGVRMEKRMSKVPKDLDEYHDLAWVIS